MHCFCFTKTTVDDKEKERERVIETKQKQTNESFLSPKHKRAQNSPQRSNTIMPSNRAISKTASSGQCAGVSRFLVEFIFIQLPLSLGLKVGSGLFRLLFPPMLNMRRNLWQIECEDLVVDLATVVNSISLSDRPAPGGLHLFGQ